jgi:hypothetical protein
MDLKQPKRKNIRQERKRFAFFWILKLNRDCKFTICRLLNMKTDLSTGNSFWGWP